MGGRTNVLILGAGLAGIAAAQAAAQAGARPLLVSSRAGGGSTFYLHRGPWGIHAARNSGPAWDTPAAHLKEILTRGEGLANPVLAEALAFEAPAALERLIAWGVEFPRNAQGALVRRTACFSGAPRAVVAAGAEAIRAPLARVAARFERLEARVDTLLAGRDGVFGALAVDAAGLEHTLTAPAVVLATGGGGGLFEHALVPADQRAEGLGLALAVGLELQDLELMQIMLGTLAPRRHDFYPLPLLAGGARLLDAAGEDRFAGISPEAYALRPTHGPFTTSDASSAIDRAVAAALRDDRAPPLLEAGGERHRVAPHAHSWCGGLPIDAHGRTALPGLFAAGEAAAGMHGANRLGGDQIAACLVFGARAGAVAARAGHSAPIDAAALRAAQEATAARIAPGADRPRLRELRRAAGRVISGAALVLRHAQGLAEALGQLDRLRHQTDLLRAPDRRTAGELLAASHSLRAAQALVACALARGESRGAHFREDCPSPAHECYHVRVRLEGERLVVARRG